MRLKTAVMTLVVAMLLAVTASAQIVLKVDSVPITAGQFSVGRYKVTSDTPALADDTAKATRADSWRVSPTGLGLHNLPLQPEPG